MRVNAVIWLFDLFSYSRLGLIEIVQVSIGGGLEALTTHGSIRYGPIIQKSQETP